MQIQQMNLDGSGSSVSELQNNNNSGYLSIAQQASAQGDGYLVVLGQNLDSATPSARTLHVFYANGVQGQCNLNPKE